MAALLNQAVAHHQAGRLDDAAALYRAILQKTPAQFDATHLLGVIALQRGDLATAETTIKQALAIKPKDAPALNNLGTALLRAGRLQEASEQFERAVKAQPAFADALSNLGNALRQLGRVAESVAPLRRAFAADAKSASIADLLGASLIETGDGRAAAAVFEAGVKARPRDPTIWTHLAIASQLAGDAKRALAAADQALQLEPSNVKAMCQRGQALAALGEIDAAREAFALASHTAPRDAAVQHNFGVFLNEQGQHAAAVERLRNALALDDSMGATHAALVDALIGAGRADEAMKHGRAFADARPDSASALAMVAAAHFAQQRMEDAGEAYRLAVAAPGAESSTFLGYGNALMANGDAVAASRQFARAIELDPQNARARFALAMSHLRAVYDDVAEMEASRRQFARAIAELDAWFTPARAATGARAIGSAQPFYLAYHPVEARPLLAPYGKFVARLAHAGRANSGLTSVGLASVGPASAGLTSTGPTSAGLTSAGPTSAGLAAQRQRTTSPLAPLRARRLRVGIAAAHVRDHSVWNAITQGWVRHLDRSRFELFLFQLERASDDETARARRDVPHFIDEPVDLAGWTQAIVDAELDVLIYPEIGMHPLTTRLAAQRLAPVQATSWGQPLTSGLPTMDLFLSAQALEPAQAAAHYTERLVALPNLGVCVQALKPVAVAPDLAQLGLAPGEPLLLCPGTPFKYTPHGDATWAAIGARLQQRGGGRLVFFRSRSGMSSRIEQRMRRAFAAADVDYDRTVAWIPTLDRGRFFGLMQRATAMLDTLGFSGFNTALQGLECGLPVVAFEGEFMRGRLASGLLRQLGLDELVAASTPEFVDIALRLVDNDAWRTHIKLEITKRRATLFDDLEPIRALEEELLNAARAATQST